MARFADRVEVDVRDADVPVRAPGQRLSGHYVRRLISVQYVEPATDLRPEHRGALAQLASANGIVVHNSFNEFSMKICRKRAD